MEQIPVVMLQRLTINWPTFLVTLKMVRSKNEAKRLIKAGAFSIDGDKVQHETTIEAFNSENKYLILRLGRQMLKADFTEVLES